MTKVLKIHEPGKTPHPHDDVNHRVVGIDLGTTRSSVAYVENQETLLVPFDGDILIPSIVDYGRGELLVGKKAQDIQRLSSGRTLSSVKRFMEDPDKKWVIGEKEVTPEEVSSEILKYLKRGAEEFLKTPIKKCVITVPAYFSESARSATRRAAFRAGLDVLRILSEPTAAAIAYGLQEKNDGLYVVYDFGGGTFDVTVLNLVGGIFQVLATGGDTVLGGDDIDHAIAEKLMPTFFSLLSDVQTMGLIKARSIKEFLSIHPDKDWKDSEGNLTFSQNQLEEALYPFLQKTLQICRHTLDDAEIFDLSQIQEVILVGGSSRFPAVWNMLKNFFGKSPLCRINPEEVVARGAAIQAQSLMFGSSHLVLDVTPLSLGLETLGGLVEKIIPRNTAIPCSIAQEFTTSHNNQTSLSIHVLQGERERVEDCHSIVRFDLRGIPPLPAGMARVRVTFSLDADGILTVEAKEKTKGVQNLLDMHPFRPLSQEKIESMLREDFSHAVEDRDIRLVLGTQQEAERLAEVVQDALCRDGDLLSEEELSEVQLSLQALKDAAHTDDLRKAIDALKEITQPFAEKRIARSIRSAHMSIF